jgi:hypothetical protein
MVPKLLQFAGSHAARQTLKKHSVAGGPLDLRFGMQLLVREKRIPVMYKLLALGLGGALTWLLVAFEAPLETVIAAFLPVIGFAADALVDGAEVVICPVIFAALMLPYLAPKLLVGEVRDGVELGEKLLR